MDRDIDSLAALNDFLSHGIFDTDVAGLDRIFWRNRTLQEFFTAYWLAQYCSEADAAGLWDWITLPERPLTEEYYWVWRFLCEMHDDAREPQAWARAIEPLFRPGDGTPEGTKRSCELIYRAWKPLDKLAAAGNKDARRVQEAFLGEFENVILAGQRGEEAQRIARQFCDSFIDVPAGEFQMGSPPEKQGMPEDLKKQWKEYLEQEGDPEERAAAHIASWTFSPGKQGQEWRNGELEWWTDVFRDKDLEAVVRRQYTSDETPAGTNSAGRWFSSQPLADHQRLVSAVRSRPRHERVVVSRGLFSHQPRHGHARDLRHLVRRLGVLPVGSLAGHELPPAARIRVGIRGQGGHALGPELLVG